MSPNDGATGVRLDAGIQFNFAEPVDRAVVKRNLHLVSEIAMADSRCQVSNSMGHGGGMMSGKMMYHFQTIDTEDAGGGHEDQH